MGVVILDTVLLCFMILSLPGYVSSIFEVLEIYFTRMVRTRKH